MKKILLTVMLMLMLVAAFCTSTAATTYAVKQISFNHLWSATTTTTTTDSTYAYTYFDTVAIPAWKLSGDRFICVATIPITITSDSTTVAHAVRKLVPVLYGSDNGTTFYAIRTLYGNPFFGGTTACLTAGSSIMFEVSLRNITCKYIKIRWQAYTATNTAPASGAHLKTGGVITTVTNNLD